MSARLSGNRAEELLQDVRPEMFGPDDAVGERLRVALRAAIEAGDVAASYFGKIGEHGLGVERKQDGTAVTIADREAELAARRVISASFPDDALHGEEFGVVKGKSGYGWLIDPIDGTISFARGVPLWGTLIAVTRRDATSGDEAVVVGVIHMPAMGGETVFAAADGGAWHVRPDWTASAQRREIVRSRVSSVESAADGVLLLTGVELAGGRRGDSAVGALIEKFGVVRGWSDCYAHLLVATGRAEACIEPMVSAWDIGPALAILPEAGGRCTTFGGDVVAERGAYLVTNGRLHDGLLTALGCEDSEDR